MPARVANETNLLGTYIYQLGAGAGDFGDGQRRHAIFVLVLTIALSWYYVRLLLKEERVVSRTASAARRARPSLDRRLARRCVAVVSPRLGLPGLLDAQLRRSCPTSCSQSTTPTFLPVRRLVRQLRAASLDDGRSSARSAIALVVTLIAVVCCHRLRLPRRRWRSAASGSAAGCRSCSRSC